MIGDGVSGQHSILAFIPVGMPRGQCYPLRGSGKTSYPDIESGAGPAVMTDGARSLRLCVHDPSERRQRMSGHIRALSAGLIAERSLNIPVLSHAEVDRVRTTTTVGNSCLGRIQRDKGMDDVLRAGHGPAIVRSLVEYPLGFDISPPTAEIKSRHFWSTTIKLLMHGSPALCIATSRR